MDRLTWGSSETSDPAEGTFVVYGSAGRVVTLPVLHREFELVHTVPSTLAWTVATWTVARGFSLEWRRPTAVTQLFI